AVTPDTGTLTGTVRIIPACPGVHRDVPGSFGQCPDGGALDVGVLGLALAGDVVGGQRRQPVAGQVGAAEVGGQHDGAAGPAAAGKAHHPGRQVALVEGVGDQD